MSSKTYEFLMALAKGEEHNRWNYPDELIYDVQPANSGTATKIVITFDNDDDFLDVLNIEEESTDRYTWNRVMSSYYSDYDSYQYIDEWSEGYIIKNFNDDNVNLVNEILRYAKPSLKLDFNVEDSSAEVSEFLETSFKSEIDDIVYEYGNLDWDCKERAIRQVLEKETANPFSRFGIIEIKPAYKYETTVGILLSLYKMIKAEDDDLKELLKKIDEKYNSHISRGSDWGELEYNVYCDDFDNEELQRIIEKNLESILEAVQEGLLEGTDFEEYNKLYDTVLKLGGFNSFIEIPEKGIQVIFETIDPTTNRLVFKLYKSDRSVERRSVDNLEDLNLELYHPELFESIRNILKKLL
jgi:hypothetical protein